MDKIVNMADIFEAKQLLQEVCVLLGQMYELINDQISNLSRLEFLSPAEFAEVYGCSLKTAQRIFDLPNFPSSDFGKEKKVEVSAAKKYFSKPRNKAMIRQ